MDVFTIMRIAGQSSTTISHRYVHPTAEAFERAFYRIEAWSWMQKVADEMAEGNSEAERVGESNALI